MPVLRQPASRASRFSALPLALTLLLCPAQPLLAAPPSGLAGISQTLQHFVDDHTVAGAVGLVAKGDRVLLLDARGMADIEAHRPMAKDTIFQIMSMTKPVTAIGIMMLAEEGKLSLRDPVEHYLPEFHNVRVSATVGIESGRLGTPDHAFTIRDLLTHTAGIRDPVPASIHDYPQLMNVPLADVVRELAKEPLLFQPGTHWSYSSPGIEILGRIIEVCSGQKYEDFIAQRILKPLGMKDSFFFPPAGKVDRIAMVYTGTDGKLAPSGSGILGGDPARHRANAVFPAPGWGLYSTAEDLLHLYRMMLNKGEYEGRRYLSPFSVQVMTEPQTVGVPNVGWMGGTDYGLAWEVVTQPLGELAGHAKGTYGHSGAFGTQGWIDPSNNLISILLIQRSNGGITTLANTFLYMAEAGAAQ